MSSGTAINRTYIDLPSDISGEILQKAQAASAVMRLARKITLPGNGVTIPVISSDPTAAWVAETGVKPVSNPNIGTKLMSAYKLAVIETFSDEFVRDVPALYDALVARLPGALAAVFDNTVIGGTAKPGTNFDNFASCTAQSLLPSSGHTIYDGLVDADADIADHGGILNGFAIGAAGRGLLMAAVDGQGRPLFVNSVAEGAIPLLLGAPVVMGKGIYVAGTAGTDGEPAVVGIAGDWSQAVYGTVEGVKISFNDSGVVTVGTDTTINLWQQNMIAVRAEIEIGFRADTDCFNLLTGAVPVS